MPSEGTSCVNRGNELQPEGMSFVNRRSELTLRGNGFPVRENGLYYFLSLFSFAFFFKIPMFFQGYHNFVIYQTVQTCSTFT